MWIAEVVLILVFVVVQLRNGPAHTAIHVLKGFMAHYEMLFSYSLSYSFTSHVVSNVPSVPGFQHLLVAPVEDACLVLWSLTAHLIPPRSMHA